MPKEQDTTDLDSENSIKKAVLNVRLVTFTVWVNKSGILACVDSNVLVDDGLVDAVDGSSHQKMIERTDHVLWTPGKIRWAQKFAHGVVVKSVIVLRSSLDWKAEVLGWILVIDEHVVK